MGIHFLRKNGHFIQIEYVAAASSSAFNGPNCEKKMNE